MGKHSDKKPPILLRSMRSKRVRLFSLFTALAASISIVVGNGVISGAYAFDTIPTYSNTITGCGVVSNYQRLSAVDDRDTYCVDTYAGNSLYADTSWNSVINNREVAIAAMMIKLSNRENQYRDKVAIAYAMHEHFDSDKSKWEDAKRRSFSTKDFSEIAAKANELWEEAAGKIPTKVLFKDESWYGSDVGEIKVKAEGITRTRYDRKDGVKFKITASNNNVVFQDNSYYGNKEKTKERNGVISTSEDYADDFKWIANGEGKVNIKGEYYLPNLEKQNTEHGCYLLRLSQSTVKYDFDGSVSVDVHREFYPTVTSKSDVNELKLGDSVEDKVKIGVKHEDKNPWIENKKIRARGYYFVGSYDSILKERAAGDNVSNYIKNLRADSTIRQVAASDVYFNKLGEEVKAIAHITNGDMNPENLKNSAQYKVTNEDAGLFGTWVWTISKDEQEDDVKGFVATDFIEGFGKTKSTSAHKAKISIKHIKDTKNKDSNNVSDTIVVSGVPKDYGKFNGSKDYGFSSDAKMKVRLWWNANLDEKLDAEPNEDSNHSKVGEWEVPLRNGTYTLADGKIMLKYRENSSAEEKVEKLASIVNVNAGNTGKSGLYVFVYDFPGSSRAEAFKTAYNDEDSRSRFTQEKEEHKTVNNNSAGNTGDSKPSGDVKPSGGNKPSGGDVKPNGDKPDGGNKPNGDSKPSGDVKPSGESKPSGGNKTNGGNKPNSDSKPSGESKPSGDVKPDGDVKPSGGNKPDGGDVKPNGDKPSGDLKPSGESKPSGDAKPSGDKPDGGDKPSSGKPNGDVKPNGGNKSDNVSTNNNDNKVNNNDNKVEESGEVTKNEIDPKTSAGGAVVDNIVNKQGSHDQGAQQNNKQDTQSNTQPNTNQNTQSQGNSTQTAQNQGGQNAGSQKQHQQTGDVEGKQNSNINVDSSQSGSDSHSAVNSDNTNVNGSSQKNNESNKVDKSDKENNAGVVDKTNAGKSGKSDNAGNAGKSGKSDNARNAGSTGKSDKSVNAKNTENADNENLSSKNVHSDKADKSSKKDSGSSVTVHKGNTNSNKKDARTTKKAASAAVSSLNTDEQNDNKSKKEASDLGSESLAESQSEYTNTKRNKRRHARAGVVSATSLFNAGIKIESVLMLSMAVLLIAGAIVLGKNIYRVVY
ncbi:hypothetical protein ACMZ89_02755 [Gardnerella vaginalis]|uniref:hypothetical protein n=1 Tax=Gardnerella vaginalis TaxID=2702 RepID=UPI0039EFB3CE